MRREEQMSCEVQFRGMFGDKRLARRGEKLGHALVEQQQVSLGKLAKNWPEQMSYYRFLNNKKVDEGSLIQACSRHMDEKVAGKHVLCISDTTELHYEAHQGRIQPNSGLGDVGRSFWGYFMHPSLVIDAENAATLGLSDVYLWARASDRPHDTGSRKKRPIEQKETYKWIQSARNSQQALPSAESITVIQDRDGDIYETFALVADSKTKLLIRSKTDRKIADAQKESLYEMVGEQAPCIRYKLEITADQKKRQQRKALMEVRYSKALLKRPANLESSTLPLTVEITMVEAREVQETVPQGEEAVVWRLLTTHHIEDFQQAIQVVYWYSLRWLIEEMFRLLKQKGFQIESSELETGYALRKLGIMTLQAAVSILQLKQARDNPAIPVDTAFDEQEQQCLEQLQGTLEGKTDKQKNPYPRNSLSWATWIIARLGGWKGYSSQRPPGVITLHDGMEKFQSIFIGWNLKNEPT